MFVCPDKVSADKIAVLRAFGARVEVCPTAVAPEDPVSYYQVSDRLVREIPGAWKPDQYSNPANPQAHYETTGPEIWEQTDRQVTHLVAGIGTGGTITGTGRFLKEVSGGEVRVVGADPVGSVYSGGTGRPYLVEGVGEDFWPAAYDRDIADEMRAVSDRDAFRMTRRLAVEHGLLVGGSSGMAASAAVEVAQSARPGSLIVVILPDGGRGYLSKVFDDDWMRAFGFLGEPTGVTVRDVLASRSPSLPGLIHVHPNEAIRDAINTVRASSASRRSRSSRRNPRWWPPRWSGSSRKRTCSVRSSAGRRASPTGSANTWDRQCPPAGSARTSPRRSTRLAGTRGAPGARRRCARWHHHPSGRPFLPLGP